MITRANSWFEYTRDMILQKLIFWTMTYIISKKMKKSSCRLVECKKDRRKEWHKRLENFVDVLSHLCTLWSNRPKKAECKFCGWMWNQIKMMSNRRSSRRTRLVNTRCLFHYKLLAKMTILSNIFACFFLVELCSHWLSLAVCWVIPWFFRNLSFL